MAIGENGQKVNGFKLERVMVEAIQGYTYHVLAQVGIVTQGSDHGPGLSGGVVGPEDVQLGLGSLLQGLVQ